VRKLTAAALTILALALTGCGGEEPAATPKSTPPPTTAPAILDPTTGPTIDEPPADPTPTRASGARTWRDAIYIVGTEIPAGRYTTTSGNSEYRCYWARLRHLDGGPTAIIAEDNLEAGETQTVDVLPTDRGFKVSNGCRWRAVS
jgi:hypothetical protein